MKIKLEICCGTTCFMLGANSLLQFADSFSQEWKEQIEVSGLPCMEACTRDNICDAPFVRVNGKIYGKMTVEKLHDLLCSILDNKEM